MVALTNIVNAINSVVWGPLMLVLILEHDDFRFVRSLLL